MPKLNLLLFLNTYSDPSSTNSANLNNFKWTRDLNGLSASNPISYTASLAPGESKTLFDGTRTLGQDGTTVYSIALKAGTANTYILTNTSGTATNFRTARAIATDATSQMTVTMNGPVATITSVAGTMMNTAGIQIGDMVRIGTLFASQNRGEFKILSKTSTSFSIENQIGIAEGPITLGAGFAAQVQVYSAAGVQANDIIKISGGFSPASWGSYKISAATPSWVEFYSTAVLPAESSITTQAIAVYSQAKQLVYLEADKNCGITINGVSGNEIEPFVVNNSTQPGMFLRKSTIYSLQITNNSADTASIFLACAE